jgi:hypothetical protein
MEPAGKILVVGGVLAIALALLEGFEVARRRRRRSAEKVHGWMLAHQVALQQGFLLLGLSLAVRLSNLSSGLESAAAWLIVAGAASSSLAQIANAVQKVSDQFAQRSLGLQLNTLQSLLLAPGVGILVVGVFKGL